jgi:hypothetical protein
MPQNNELLDRNGACLVRTLLDVTIYVTGGTKYNAHVSVNDEK